VPSTPEKPIVIAHRGASGYLPEHTLEAKALAFGMGADFLEQDVVATADDELVVLHDIHLDRVTDVAARFPARHRDDGHFYVRDFKLSELKSLNVHERRNADGSPVFPRRFPTSLGRFGIATLDEELEMVRGLSASSRQTVGIYPEIKAPSWHLDEGVDLSALVLDCLDRQGYRRNTDPVYLQCFDARELRRIRRDLGSELKLVQLIDENSTDATDGTDYERLRSAQGLREAAEYADAIGPALSQLYVLAEIDGHPVSTGLVTAARAAGLKVHPYTFRADALAPGFGSFREMVDWFTGTLGVDGFFTDFPNLVLEALDRRRDPR